MSALFAQDIEADPESTLQPPHSLDQVARDPVDIIEQNKGRILQYHVKDMNQAGSFTDLGEGLIDFARIFELSEKAGAVEYIVERDNAGSPPRQPADALTTAEVGYDFLAAIRF